MDTLYSSNICENKLVKNWNLYPGGHFDLIGTLVNKLAKLLPSYTDHHPHHVVMWPSCTEHIWTSVNITSVCTSECWTWVPSQHASQPVCGWETMHHLRASRESKKTIQLPGEPIHCLKPSREPRATIQEQTFTRNILWHLCNCDIYLCCVPLNSPWFTTGLFEIYLFSFYSSSILFSFRFCTRVKVVYIFIDIVMLYM